MTQAPEQTMLMRNTPVSAREWRERLDSPGATVIDAEVGQMAIVPERGQLTLCWAFTDIDTMRQHYTAMFDALKPEIADADVDFLTMDFVQVQNRDWLKPLLDDTDFHFFAEWIEMTHPGLDPEVIPEFPEGVTMRRATDDDVERMYEIWTEAYGDLLPGPGTFDYYLEHQTWTGALEQDGKVVAFAINGPVEAAVGEIFDAVVAPEARGHGYGQLVLAAAAYQLSTQEARRATVRVRPDIKQALRTCSEMGFKPGRAGLEYRRTTDEEAIKQRRDERRVAGVKARFGGWR
ncbi:MAG: GNAT family N-acetyltransferase [Dehalococcoidia bacterium]|nr:GNAT family N-acetyltransferase [Dehalococcoidia bacterium]